MSEWTDTLDVRKEDFPPELLAAIERTAAVYGLHAAPDDWDKPEVCSIIGLAVICYRLGVQHGREDAE